MSHGEYDESWLRAPLQYKECSHWLILLIVGFAPSPSVLISPLVRGPSLLITRLRPSLLLQEGPLVKAVRHGHWVVLDELNLVRQCAG